MIELELKFKDEILKKVEIDKPEIIIGRSSNADIQIDNLAVSKLHAKLIKENGHYLVEDLNSTNGTFLNDRKVPKAALKHSDIVTIGKHTLTIYYKSKSNQPTQDFADRTVKVKI